eukprot:403355041
MTHQNSVRVLLNDSNSSLIQQQQQVINNGGSAGFNQYISDNHGNNVLNVGSNNNSMIFGGSSNNGSLLINQQNTEPNQRIGLGLHQHTKSNLSQSSSVIMNQSGIYSSQLSNTNGFIHRSNSRSYSNNLRKKSDMEKSVVDSSRKKKNALVQDLKYRQSKFFYESQFPHLQTQNNQSISVTDQANSPDKQMRSTLNKQSRDDVLEYNYGESSQGCCFWNILGFGSRKSGSGQAVYKQQSISKTSLKKESE